MQNKHYDKTSQSANCFHAAAMIQSYFRNVQVVLHFIAPLGGRSCFCVHLQAKIPLDPTNGFY